MLIARKRRGVWRTVKDVGLDHRLDQFVVCPHHPDRLRRPSPRPGTFHADVNLGPMLRNSHEMRVIACVPPIYRQPTSELAAL